MRNIIPFFAADQVKMKVKVKVKVKVKGRAPNS